MTRRQLEIAYLAQLGIGWLCVLLLTRYFVSPGLGWGSFMLSLPALAAGIGGAALLIGAPLLTLLLPEDTQRLVALRRLLLLPLSSLRAFIVFSAGLLAALALTISLITTSATVWLRSCSFAVRICESADLRGCSAEIAHIPPNEDIYLRVFRRGIQHIAVDTETNRLIARVDHAFTSTLTRPALPVVLCPSPVQITAKCQSEEVLLAVTSRGDVPVNVRRPTLQRVFEDSIRLTAASQSADVVLPALTLGAATVPSPAHSSYDVKGTAVFTIPFKFQLPEQTGSYVFVGRPCVSRGLIDDVCGEELVKLSWGMHEPRTACQVVNVPQVDERVRDDIRRCDTSTNRQDMKLLLHIAPAELEPLLLACVAQGIAEHLMVIDVLSSDTSDSSKQFLNEQLQHYHPSVRLAAVDALSLVDPKFDKVAVLTQWITKGRLDQASNSVDALRDGDARNAACVRRMSGELKHGVDCGDGDLTALLMSCVQAARDQPSVVRLVSQYCRACPEMAGILRAVSGACRDGGAEDATRSPR